ncbi:NAD(P)H azoreductase [Streptomyces sp. YIM 130001]|uniref:SDR family oxidoreductase n=1 Tax=Streptomyces sp. YIM 130001 TaxID=2259644 RepID=UPI000E64A8BF|nr:SDR family oxidoreductase [Streptomyces sp. YIM 130001]RII06894.1 NAD(P)H azoreductase [Streptomyces sp. YIM 130001]
MILVTGATGTIGREVARLLLAGPEPVRLVSRRAAEVTAAAPGADAVRADYGEASSLRPALKGVRAVFLVTNRPTEQDDDRFLDAARAGGVRHIVKLSAAGVTDARATDVITRWQRDTERLLRNSGMEWTLLRPRSFMSNALSWAATVRAHGTVRAVAGSGPNATIDPRDVAAVAARVLTEEGHEDRIYTLTGPQAITPAEQTHQLSQVLGTPLRFEEQAPRRARAQLLRRYPSDVADALLAMAQRQRDGAKATVESTVHDVTGQRPRSFLTWAADHAQHFGGVREKAVAR